MSHALVTVSEVAALERKAEIFSQRQHPSSCGTFNLLCCHEDIILSTLDPLSLLARGVDNRKASLSGEFSGLGIPQQILICQQ
jgi:hypothetical protein